MMATAQAWRVWALALFSTLLLGGLAAPGTALAQSYPNKIVKIVVPYTPGGITDTVTRMVGEQLATALGQPIVVENKPGANSIIGADTVAKSPPDGHTLVMVIGAHAANATLYAGRLPFDPIADFAPVSLVGTTPLVMVASSKTGIGNFAEFVAAAKAKPGTLNYGSSGVGAAAHLTMEYLKRRAGIDVVHVPYRGTAPALTDVMAGNITAMFDTLSAMKPQIDAGTIRGVALASEKRSSYAPDLPTFAEAGLPDFVSSTWTMLMMPAKTPKEIVERVSSEVAKIVRSPAFTAKLEGLGIEPVGNSPEQATEFLKAEVAKWGAIIRDANVKID
jgi:tripartite-type tricarboxylate transporter receptor subunit TctC